MPASGLRPTRPRSGHWASVPSARWARRQQVVAVATELTQLLPQSTEGASGSVEDRPAPTDTAVVLQPPSLPLQTRVAMPKRLLPRSR